MFDTFNNYVAKSDFKNAMLNAAAQLAAIQTVLYRAGLATPEEFDTICAQCETFVDQELAKRKELMWQEFSKENPDAAKGMEFLMKIMPGFFGDA